MNPAATELSDRVNRIREIHGQACLKAAAGACPCHFISFMVKMGLKRRT